MDTYCMTFNDLLTYIRSQGCKVTLYKTKSRLADNAVGLFYEEPYPQIKIATKGHDKKELASIILHEFAHFCQWRDGFSRYLDAICWPHNVHEEWIAGDIELTDRERSMVLATMISVEYDAEMRAYALGKELGITDFNPTYHLREAQSYIAAIKWSFANRKEWKKRPHPKYFPAQKLTFEELFAPLTDKEIRLMDKHMRY